MSRLIITGDKHSESNDLYWVIQKTKMTADDWLVILGDFGFVWDGSWQRNIYKIHRMTKGHIFVILGNHENYNIIQSLPHEYKEEVHGEVYLAGDRVWIAYDAGGIYNICGKKILAINGADSHDKEWRTPDVSWWEQERLTFRQMEYIYNLADGNHFDYIFSHCCGSQLKKMTFHYNDPSPMENFLNEIYLVANFEDAFCGHYHIDEDKGKFHFLYNSYKILVEEE